MQVNICMPSTESKETYHINPCSVVSVHEHNGRYFLNTVDGDINNIDRESYDRIVAWMERQ